MAKKQQNVEILTRGTKKIIATAIEKTGDLNRSVLCNAICEDLCSKFSGDSLEYQLTRMNLTTTGDINKAIDTYMYRHIKLNKNNEDEDEFESLE